MTPYVTPELSEVGKKVLRYQCEGVECGDLWTSLKHRCVMAAAIPVGHSFQAAWLLQLIFDDGHLIELSSSTTQIVGWDEYGSLNIAFATTANELGSAAVKFIRTSLPPLSVHALYKLIHEDESVITECGLILCGSGQEEIIVAAGVPPGSVSISAGVLPATLFDPQFPAPGCKRERLMANC